MMKPCLFITIASALLLASCQKGESAPAGAGGAVAFLPEFRGVPVVPPSNAKLGLIERTGDKFSCFTLNPQRSETGFVVCDATAVTDWAQLSLQRIFGAVYSDIAGVSDGNVTFTMPDGQIQSPADPGSGRHMCLIADRVDVRDPSGVSSAAFPGNAKISIGFRSLTSVIKLPVVHIPSGERLTSVTVKAAGSELPFVKTLCLAAIYPDGRPSLGTAPAANWYTDTVQVNLEEAAEGEATVSLSVMPRYLIECLLNGAEPAAKDLAFDVTFKTVNQSQQESTYLFNGCPMDASKWMFDASYTFNNKGVPFDLSGDASRLAVVTISGEQRQLLRFGVDAERLWYYWPNQRERLAEVAVKDLKADYVRVAINCGYEREEGNIDITAYTDDIIPLMTYLKKSNPRIKFYASTRPLKEAYDVNKNPDDAAFVSQNFKNGNIAMYAYPLWVGGHKNVLIDQFKKFKKDNMVRYLADYLNLMKSYEFDIEYMDLTNEEQDIWEGDIDNIIYVIDELPKHLNAGVNMPKIVFPSTWSPGDGFKRFLDLNKVKGNEKAIFDKLGVVSTHNTPDTDISSFDNESLVRFADAVHAIDPDKELWNTEMHGWVGTQDPVADMRNSEIFWKHIRAGFTGIDTWLFYGPWAGTDHSMIYSNNNNAPVATTKFEIFKTVVNEMNLGYHIWSDCSADAVTSVAMRKGSKMMLCMHNMSGKGCSLRVDLPDGLSVRGKIGSVRWEESLRNVAGIKGADFEPETPGSFLIDVPMNSVVCYLFETDAE